MNFTRIIDPKFIFNPGLGPMNGIFVWIFYTIFGLFLVLSLASYVVARKNDKLNKKPLARLWHKLNDFFLYLGLTGLLLLFFRQQRIYFLSMPLFMYLWLIWAIIWFYLIYKWIKIRMTNMKQEIQERIEKEKYFS